MDITKKKKLGKLEMPKRKSEEMDMEGLEVPEETESEEPMMESDMESVGFEAAPEDKMDAEPSADLQALSDDDLLAEIKKRGLMAQLAGKGEEEAMDDEQEMYS